MVRKSMFSAEEKKLLEEFQKDNKGNPNTGLYTFLGGFTALLPIYIFTFILHVDFESNIIVMGIVSAVAAYALSKSYANLAIQLKPQFEKVVVASSISSSKDDNQSKEQRLAAAKKRAARTAEQQSSSLAIFQNNAVFMGIFMFLCFFMFVNLSMTANYILSVGLAAGLVLLKSS